MTKHPEAFQAGLDAYYEDRDVAALRAHFEKLSAQHLADFNAGYACAEEQDAA